MDLVLGERVAAAAVDELPDALDGAAFLERWGATGDDVTAVEAGETYLVRAATSFGVSEHAHSGAVALASLPEGEPERLARCWREPRRVRRHGPGPSGGDGHRGGGARPAGVYGAR